MARKNNKGGGKRQRAQQRAQYDELDKYPVLPPHAFARIVRDKQTLNIIYQIIEPPMTKKEQEQRSTKREQQSTRETTPLDWQ